MVCRINSGNQNEDEECIFAGLSKRSRVAVVSFPWHSPAPYKFLDDLLRILDQISGKVTLIGGNLDRTRYTSRRVEKDDIGISMHYARYIGLFPFSVIRWLCKMIAVQLIECIELVRLRNEIDIVVFYMAYPYYLLPLLMAKILNKRSFEVLTRGNRVSFLSKLVSVQDPLLYRLLDGISPESMHLVEDLKLEEYASKLLPVGARFVDLDKHRITTPLKDRKNVVGYVGRFAKEKGVVEFMRSIPLIHNLREDVSYLIAGGGELEDWVARECDRLWSEEGISIDYLGWIGEDLPKCLNRLRLLVLPTRSDALPSIILEAMACGTPVLVHPVGGIEDIVKSGVTGFLIRCIGSKEIAESVCDALCYKEIDQVAANARNLVEREFGYAEALSRWKEILREVKRSEYG